jgi:hypothetical protein
MASTPSTLLLLELMATTENSGTWGSKANTLFQILEAAITGVFAVSTTGGTTTLANVNYTVDDAKNRTIDVSGALVSNAIIVIPNLKRQFRINNRTTGSFTVSVKTSGGSSIAVTQGTMCDILCDGSNVCTFATPMVVPGTGAPASSTGAVASSVSVTPTGNISSTNAQAALAEIQGDVDTINALLISGYQPLNARLTDLSSVAATKGNIYVGSGTNIVALGIGTNGFVTVADSSSTNGMKWAALIPAGTVSLFYQSSAPTGWTVSDADSNKAIRIVSGSSGLGGAAGGTTAFTSVFTSRTIAQANLPNYNLTVADPGHTHTATFPMNGATSGSGNGSYPKTGSTSQVDTSGSFTTNSNTTGISVSSAGSGTAMDFSVQYISVIKAAKAAY